MFTNNVIKVFEKKLNSQNLSEYEQKKLFKELVDILSSQIKGNQLKDFCINGHPLSKEHVSQLLLYCAEISLRQVSFDDLFIKATVIDSARFIIPALNGLDTETQDTITRALYYRITELLRENDNPLSQNQHQDFHATLQSLSVAFETRAYAKDQQAINVLNNLYICSLNVFKERVSTAYSDERYKSLLVITHNDFREEYLLPSYYIDGFEKAKEIVFSKPSRLARLKAIFSF